MTNGEADAEIKAHFDARTERVNDLAREILLTAVARGEFTHLNPYSPAAQVDAQIKALFAVAEAFERNRR